MHTYRYLLPLVWSFPFLTGYLYDISSRRIRVAIGAGAIILALFNLTTGIELMRTWSRPGFASTQADMPIFGRHQVPVPLGDQSRLCHYVDGPSDSLRDRRKNPLHPTL